MGVCPETGCGCLPRKRAGALSGSAEMLLVLSSVLAAPACFCPLVCVYTVY